jgi:hypothetical protein
MDSETGRDEAARGETGHDGGPGVREAAGGGPVAADRPVVDGTTASPAELRAEAEAEAEALQDPNREHIAQLRADVAATTDELSARLDVSSRAKAGAVQLTSDLRTAWDRAREHPGILAAVATVGLLGVVGRWRLSSRRRRARR